VTAHYPNLDQVKKNSFLRLKFLRIGAFAVSAAACLAQTTAITRVEETNPNLVFAGAWVPDTVGAPSGGSALMSDQASARVTVSFTGTGITWIGDTGVNRGVARVSLDGTVNVVDTYSPTWHDQQTLFVAKGLAAGPHSFSIEVAQMQNTSAQGSLVSVDAFDIANGTVTSGGVVANPGYIEQNNPAITYTGSWYVNNSIYAGGGSAVLAMDSGSSATVKFNGTGITWIGFMDLWSGYAQVYLDGTLKTTLDLWGMPYGDGCSCETWQRPISSTTGLPNGPHTLTIKVLGQKSDKSGGNWIWIDAFRILGPATMTP
jgi:hypothetical protein